MNESRGRSISVPSWVFLKGYCIMVVEERNVYRELRRAPTVEQIEEEVRHV